jgi:enamine deaminase RidA (YjgF/YER057c/UK114 family)
MEKRQKISSNNPWERQASYSRAIRVGNVVEVAGTTALEEDKVVGQGNMYEQTLYILKEKINKALKEAGSSLDHVVRTRIYITDINLWEEAARAHTEVFEDILPVSTFLEVPRLIRVDLLVEVEATAIIPG